MDHGVTGSWRPAKVVEGLPTIHSLSDRNIPRRAHSRRDMLSFPLSVRFHPLGSQFGGSMESLRRIGGFSNAHNS